MGMIFSGSLIFGVITVLDGDFGACTRDSGDAPIRGVAAGRKPSRGWSPGSE